MAEAVIMVSQKSNWMWRESSRTVEDTTNGGTRTIIRYKPVGLAVLMAACSLIIMLFFMWLSGNLP